MSTVYTLMRQRSNVFLNSCFFQSHVTSFDQSLNADDISRANKLFFLINVNTNFQQLHSPLLPGFQVSPFQVSNHLFNDIQAFKIIKDPYLVDEVSRQPTLMLDYAVPYLPIPHATSVFPRPCYTALGFDPFCSTTFLNSLNTHHHMNATSSNNTNLFTNNQLCPHHPIPEPMQSVNKEENDNLYSVVMGEHILSPSTCYEVLSFLGQGTFGQVLKCRSNKYGFVAMKVLKSHPAFHRQGMVEIGILQLLNHENTDAFNIVRTVEFFQHQSHICLVFELLNQNLYDYVKANKFAPMPLNDVRLIAHQVLNALAKLKQIGLIHADLKPENIMLVDYSHDGKQNSDLPFIVKVIDFGSACLTSQAIPNIYLQSRYYRSPEILLGMPFNEAIDMWSLGCICAELFLGYPIYPGLSEFDQMRYIVETQGLPPLHILKRATKYHHYFVMNANGSHRLKLRAEYSRETGKSSRETRIFIFSSLYAIEDAHFKKSRSDSSITTDGILITGLNPSSDLKEMEAFTEACDRREFADFLCQLMHLDPSKRYDPNMALEHPFINMNHLFGFSTVCPSVRDGFARRRALLYYYYNLSMNQPQHVDCVPLDSRHLHPHVNVITPEGDLMFNVGAPTWEPPMLISTGKSFHGPMHLVFDPNWCVHPLLMTGDPFPVNDHCMPCMNLNSEYCDSHDCVNQQGNNGSSESLLSLLQQQCSSLASSFTLDNKPNSNAHCDCCPHSMLNTTAAMFPNTASLNQPLISQDEMYQPVNIQNSCVNNATRPSQCEQEDYPQTNYCDNSCGNCGDMIYQNTLRNVSDIPTAMISGVFGLSLDFFSPVKSDTGQPCNNLNSDCTCEVAYNNHSYVGEMFPGPSMYYPNVQHIVYSPTRTDMVYDRANMPNTVSSIMKNVSPNQPRDSSFHFPRAVGEKIFRNTILNISDNSLTATRGIFGFPLDFCSPVKSINIFPNSTSDKQNNNCLSRDSHLQTGALFPNPQPQQAFDSKPKPISPLPLSPRCDANTANNDLSSHLTLTTWLRDLRMAINSTCEEPAYSTHAASNSSPCLGIHPFSPCKGNCEAPHKLYPMQGGYN